MTATNQEKSRDQFLRHYGVLGMRWGKRKGRVTTSSSGKKSSNGQNGNRRMSNKELNARVKRLRLEQEYAKLSTPPRTVSRVEQIAKSAGSIAALSTTALTLYKNFNEISKLAAKASKAVQ